MLDVLVIGVVVATIGAMIATGMHYIFARQFARRYAGAFDIRKILTNDMMHLGAEYAPKAISLLSPVISQAVYDGIIRAQGQVAQQVIHEEMSARGARGAEVRAERKMQREAQRATVMAMIEEKFPGASAFLPVIEKQLGMDLVGMAAANPQAAMALISRFAGGQGAAGFGGGGQGW